MCNFQCHYLLNMLKSKRTKRLPFKDTTNKNKNSKAIVSSNSAIISTCATTRMHLRKRKVKDYNTLLRDSFESDDKKANKKHLPIYLQKLNTKEDTNKSDPFQFTETHSKRNKKDDNTDSDSSTFEKSMQGLLRDIENKEKKAKTLRKKTIKKHFIAKNPNKNKKVDLGLKNSDNGMKKTRKENLAIIKNQDYNAASELANTLDNEIGNGTRLLTSTPVDAVNKNLPQQHSKQINILTNVLIQPANTPLSPTHSFDESYQAVNDSDLEDYNTFRTPWRGDNLNLRRNPHWLSLKDTSLPYYNQEMILQPELLERNTGNKSIRKPDSYIQTQISDFVLQGNNGPVNKVNNISILFDEQRFSPLKAKTNPVSSLFDQDDDFSLLKNNKNNESVKRTILGSLNRSSSFENTDNTHCNYSFSVMDHRDKENTPKQFKNKKKSPNALPMRINMSDVKRFQKEAAEELNDVTINESIGTSQQCDETTDNYPVVGLFEDLEPSPTVGRTYSVKKQRKARLGSVEKEHEEVRERTKKKKKDLRTNAEKRAFNKWAAGFNAMCEEVEQHHLEIETV